MSAYQCIANVIFLHEYFSRDGVCDVEIRWSPASEGLAKNMGLMLKSTASGCRILFDNHVFETPQAMLQAFCDEVLSLVVRPYNVREFAAMTPNFCVTDDHLAYFSLVADSVIAESGVAVCALGIDKIADFSLDQQHAMRSLGIRRSRTDILLFMAAQTLLECLIAPANNHALRPLSIELRVNTYETYIKYYLFGYEPEVKLAIVDTKKHMTFSPCGEESHNGRTAKIFISDDVIPIRFRSANQFQLVKQGGSRETVVMDSLPLPKLGHYCVAQLNGDEVFVSEAFVN